MLCVGSVEVTTLALVGASVAFLCTLALAITTSRVLRTERQALVQELRLVAQEEARTRAAVVDLTATFAKLGSQAWFWSNEWQDGEAEADADIASGRVDLASSVDEMFDVLDESSESCTSASGTV